MSRQFPKTTPAEELLDVVQEIGKLCERLKKRVAVVLRKKAMSIDDRRTLQEYQKVLKLRVDTVRRFQELITEARFQAIVAKAFEEMDDAIHRQFFEALWRAAEGTEFLDGEDIKDWIPDEDDLAEEDP